MTIFCQIIPQNRCAKGQRRSQSIETEIGGMENRFTKGVTPYQILLFAKNKEKCRKLDFLFI